MGTEVIKVNPTNPERVFLKWAADILRDGGLVAFPTETVYGLGANYLDAGALERLYAVKSRPSNKPFTVHIADIDVPRALSCEISPRAKAIIDKFWPGPLTLVLAAGNGKNIGFRMPRNRLALEFITLCGVPVVAPSANLSGNVPPRNCADVLKDLDGRIDLVLDGGQTEVGVESTVCDISGESVRILREGAIPAEEIMGALNQI